VDQESVDTGDERYRAALRLLSILPFVINFSVCEIYPIRPKPEDSVSVDFITEAWITAIFPFWFWNWLVVCLSCMARDGDLHLSTFLARGGDGEVTATVHERKVLSVP